MTADFTELAELQRVVQGRFIIERELGRGGMGIVYLAHDHALDRRVAIKLLFPHLAVDEEFRARFLTEARIAARLSHPNIVTVHSVESHGDLVFFVMAFVDGESLADRIHRSGRLRPSDAVRYLREVAWALGYAHGNGIIHRDVKPANILIDRATGRALLADFGIAGARAGRTATFDDGMGTPRYMSPEQALGEPLDGRSDLYSFGVVGFHALSGRLPFTAANPVGLRRQHVEKPPPPLAPLVPKIPTELARVIEQCLAKRPADRPQSGEAIAELLATSKAIVPEAAPAVRLFLRRTAVVGQGAVTVVIGTVVYAWFRSQGVHVSVSADFPIVPVLAVLATVGLLRVATFLMVPARRLRLAGFTWNHVAEAIRDEKRREDEEQAVAASRLDAPVARWPFAAAPAHFPRIALLGAFVGVNAIVVLLISQVTGRSVLAEPMFVEAVGAIVAIVLLSFSEEFLTPIRKALVRLAGWGIPVETQSIAAVAAQPTETRLRGAATEAFQRLPGELQRRFGEIPEIIRTLGELAERLRKNPSRKPEDLHRLATATAALDDVRLLLAGLEAGATSEGELTEAIARVDEIRRQVEAHFEVERIVARQ